MLKFAIPPSALELSRHGRSVSTVALLRVVLSRVAAFRRKRRRDLHKETDHEKYRRVKGILLSWLDGREKNPGQKAGMKSNVKLLIAEKPTSLFYQEHCCNSIDGAA